MTDTAENDAPRHNHMTRDVKPPGVCPACDRYHEAHGVIPPGEGRS